MKKIFLKSLIDFGKILDMNKLKHCIIGANSKIVKALNLQSNFHMVSHNDIKFYDFSKFDMIWVFSWSTRSITSNLNIIESIPDKKIIFISSQAVMSMSVANQPYNYVNWKKICEDRVLSKAGEVIRIASVNEDQAKNYAEVYAHTNIMELQNYMLQKENVLSGEVIPLFNIKTIDKKNTILFNYRNRLIDYLRINKKFNYLHACFCMFFKVPSYGYSRDCQKLLANKVVIGYGAVGSYALKNRLKMTDKIFVNFEKNIILNNNGFKNTLIGRGKSGLAKLMHGVSTEAYGGLYVKKFVKFFPGLFYIPANVRSQKIRTIKFIGSKWQILCESPSGQQQVYYSNKLILAAGWLENTRLLSCLSECNSKLKFSDDESAFIGSVSVEEAIRSNLIQRSGLFIKHKFGKIVDTSIPCFIEARAIPSEIKLNTNYYDGKGYKIIKIITKFNLKKFNSVIFNKFGFMIYTKNSIELLATYLCEDSIECSVGNGIILSLSRKVLLTEKFLENLNGNIKKGFASYKPSKNVKPLDGIHVVGGSDILKQKRIADLIISKKLLVLGPPNKSKIDPFHTTKRLQESAYHKVMKFD